MDTKLLFNNPEDSDAKIILADGSLHCHRVVLKHHSKLCKTMLNSGLSESAGEIKFHNQEDSVIISAIRFIYGLPADIADSNMWLHLIYFAHFIEAKSLILHLINNIPNDTALSSIIRAADELCDRGLMLAAVKIIRRHLPLRFDEMAEQISSAVQSDKPINATYLTIRGIWLDEKFDSFSLFTLDCKLAGDHPDYLIDLIPSLDFDQFDPAQLAICSNLTAHIPHLQHLFNCMSMRQQKVKNGRRPRQRRKT